MDNFIINFMNKWGYVGVLILITLENVFPPIPSEVILTFGGFMTTYSNMNIFFVILFATIGSIVGAIILYYVGKFLNVDKLKKLLNSKLGKILRVKESDVDNASDWFNNKGEYTLFFCRFVPIVRSLISIPAGMNKMNLFKFLIYTFYGSLVWNSVLCILGRVFGNAYPLIISFVDKYSKLVLIILIISFIVFLIYKKKKKDF